MQLLWSLVVVLGMSMTNAIEEFWNWFEDTQSSFPTSATFDETYGDEITEQLTRIHPDLVYETAIPASGERELVISADGIKEMIPIVNAVVDAAPELQNWKFTAFRPRLNDYTGFELNYAGHTFDPKSIWFWARIEDGHFDVKLYHPNYNEDDRNLIVSASYILLDMAIGEHDVMTGIRYIDHDLLPKNPEQNELLPFSELRSVFDQYRARHRN